MDSKIVDKTKKSNIKCEHCNSFVRVKVSNRPSTCSETGKPKHYWNRCKKFSWKD